MIHETGLMVPAIVVALGIGAALASHAGAGTRHDSGAHASPEPPPGLTEADMRTYMEAASPGEMHRFLAEGAGVWRGRTTLWLVPGSEPVEGESVTTVTPIMDGRFVRGEISGEAPGMGPYTGLDIRGYDNVAGRFVATRVDSYGTGIASGVGERSDDGKTMTWRYTFHCPMTREQAVHREVETITGPHTRTIEIFGSMPGTDGEYRLMRIELTRQPDSVTRIGATAFSTPSDLEFVAERVIDAPRELAFEAWTSPEHLPHWLTGPEGWTTTACEVDLRPGGAQRMAWRRPDGAELEIRGTFREIVAPERVVNTERWGGGDWPETLNTTVFTPAPGSGTRITCTVRYPTKEARDAAMETGMAAGMAQSFDRLARYLESLR